MITTVTCPSCTGEFATSDAKPAFVIRGMSPILVELALSGMYNIACPECIAMFFERGLKGTSKPAPIPTTAPIVQTEPVEPMAQPVEETAQMVPTEPVTEPVVEIVPAPAPAAAEAPIAEKAVIAPVVSATIVAPPSGPIPVAVPRHVQPPRPPMPEGAFQMRKLLGLKKPVIDDFKDADAAKEMAGKYRLSSHDFKVFADGPSAETRTVLNGKLVKVWGDVFGLAAIALSKEDALALNRTCYGYGAEAESIARSLEYHGNVVQLRSLERPVLSGKKHKKARGPNATNVPPSVAAAAAAAAAAEASGKKGKKQGNGKK